MIKYSLVKALLQQVLIEDIENQTKSGKSSMSINATCKIGFKKDEGKSNAITFFIDSDSKISNKHIKVSYVAVVGINDSAFKLTDENIKEFVQSNFEDITKPIVSKVVKMIAVLTDEMFGLPIIVDFKHDHKPIINQKDN